MTFSLIWQMDRLVGNCPIARELVWLEGRAFVALACGAVPV
jgi:hypothetical protein